MANEICIICGKETTVDINTHVDYRIGYIEGAGQLCPSCYNKDTNDDYITVPKDLIHNTPNNFDLGEKIRQMYYNI